MLLILPLPSLKHLPLNPESQTLLRTGELRIGRPSDRLIELSENALFLVRISHIRPTAAIAATWDGGRLMLPLKNRNPARALLLLRFARRLFVRRSRRVISASPIRRISTGYGVRRAPLRPMLRRMNWHIASVARRISFVMPRERIRSDYCERPL